MYSGVQTSTMLLSTLLARQIITTPRDCGIEGVLFQLCVRTLC